MIEVIYGKGVNRVCVICDECGWNEVVMCDYQWWFGGFVFNIG